MATSNVKIMNLVAVAADADNEFCNLEARVAELEAENAMLKKMLEPGSPALAEDFSDPQPPVEEPVAPESTDAAGPGEPVGGELPPDQAA